jgi:hypothetical protein
VDLAHIVIDDEEKEPRRNDGAARGPEASSDGTIAGAEAEEPESEEDELDGSEGDPDDSEGGETA